MFRGDFMGRGNSPPNKLKPYMIAAAAGLSVICGIVIVSSWLISFFDMPEGTDVFFSYIALSCGCVFSGRFCGKRMRHNGILNGFGCGLLVVGVLIFVSLFTGNFCGDVIFFKVSVAGVTGAFGGVIGVNAQIRI